MARYKWPFPSDWLDQKIGEAASSHDITELADLARSLMRVLPEDDIQDVFQGDMENDGYFVDLDAPKRQDDESEDD